MYSKTDVPAELKVSGKTHPNKLGGAIARYLKEAPAVHLTAMGEASVNAAVKGIIVAQSFLAFGAEGLSVKLGFATNFDEALNKEVTVIKFFIKLDGR